MKSIEPISLLFIWLFLSFIGRGNLLITQVILSQMTAIHIVRRAEKNINLNLENDEGFRGFLLALWFDPNNGSAYTYCRLIGQLIGLTNYRNGEKDNYMLRIEDIRVKITNNQFEFSKHAVDQSISRQIRLHEIVEVISNGQIIEDYPDDKYAPSCLICGFTEPGRAIHVQCSYPMRTLIKIITVYEPNSKKWNSNFTIRKTNNE